MHVIYDVSHNIAKMEQHYVDGKPKHLLVHRKVFRTFILFMVLLKLYKLLYFNKIYGQT